MSVIDPERHIKDLYQRIDELEAELEKAREDSKRLNVFLEHPWGLINEDGDFPKDRKEFDAALETFEREEPNE